MLRLVTVVFADVVDSTARAERMHPEDIHNHMSSYFAAMSKEIVGEGGSVERLLGDAVLAVFGIPVAHEDDPIRAARASRRMLARLERWNADKDSDMRLQIRIGINTGEVLVRGAPGQELLVSDAVNVAARLQHAAGSGTIVVGPRTARAIEGAFDLRALEPLVLKGKSETIPAWLVEGELTGAVSLGIRGQEIPLVGRRSELEQLHARFQEATRTGTPFRATISGDVGVGKTRLAREFLMRIEGQAKVLKGRCLPYGEGISLWPLGEILRAEAHILDTDPPEIALARVHALVERYTLEVFRAQSDQTVAGLAASIGLISPESKGLDPTEAYEELLRAWRVLLTSMAADSPVVAIVDDLQWADQTMLEVIDDLTQTVQGPTFFLCAARAELMKTRPRWGIRFQNESLVPLHPLNRVEGAQLARELLLNDKAPVGLSAALLEKSEGNPFFMEEIVRQLIDEGRLLRVHGGWELTAPISDVDIPDNVQAVIAARLDLLEPQEHSILQIAAVLGRIFWKGAIETIAGTGPLDSIMQKLQARDFITRRLSSSMGDEVEYTFSHALIRDVAYERLTRRARATTHVSFAQWIENRSGDRVNEVAELLAYHYGQAFSYAGGEELREKARQFHLTSSRNALGRFAISQAEMFGRRAVDLSLEGMDRVQALEALGDVCYLTYKIDGAWQAYKEAIEELERAAPIDQRTIAHLAAKASIVPTRWQGSMHQVPEKEEVDRMLATGFATVAKQDSRDLSMLLTSKAFYQIMGFEEMDESGEQAAQEAVEFAEQLGHADLVSSALDAVSGWLLPAGSYGDLDEIHHRRLSLVERLTDPKEICDVYAMSAYSSFHMGYFARAVDHATACIERARRIDAGGYLHGLVWRVCGRFMTGDWAGAMTDQAEIERLTLEDQRDAPVPFAVRAYGMTLFYKHLRGEDAEDYLRLLRDFHSQPQAAANHPGSRAILARYLAYTGDPDAGRMLLELKRSHVLCVHLEALTEVLAAQGDWDEAERAIPIARDEAERAALVSLPCFVDRLEGRLAHVRGNTGLAMRALERSADGFERLGAPWEQAYSLLLLVEVLAEDDRRSQAIAAAEVALGHFSRLGSANEQRRVTKLLAELGGSLGATAS